MTDPSTLPSLNGPDNLAASVEAPTALQDERPAQDEYDVTQEGAAPMAQPVQGEALEQKRAEAPTPSAGFSASATDDAAGAGSPAAPPAPVKAPTFDVLPLSGELRETLAEIGYLHPTPVQLAVWEPATRGRDAMVQARTGTGKTAAFGLPIVDHIVKRSNQNAQVLALCPTRELAVQVSNEIERLGRRKGVKVIAIYGGAPMQRQIDAIAAGAQVIVGTPGRVLDHLRRGTLSPKHIRLLVLDECDEMLSMGFERELSAILAELPPERQTLLFSATVPPDIERISKQRLKNPEFVTLSSDAVGALSIQHFVYLITGDKAGSLVRILEIENPESAIIFCNTRDETETVTAALRRQGYDAEWLNGDLPQNDRERVMTATREGRLRFLVATDVAARGIDISHLTHVINYDFPQDSESYVHRTGRTGRAGRTGTAVSLITPQDMGPLYLLRLTYKIRPLEKQIPTEGELKTRAEADLVTMLAEAFLPKGVHADDLALARRLLTHDQADLIVAGLLRDHLGARPSAKDEAGAARRAALPRPAPPPAPPKPVTAPAAPPARAAQVSPPAAPPRAAVPAAPPEGDRERAGRGESRGEPRGGRDALQGRGGGREGRPGTPFETRTPLETEGRGASLDDERAFQRQQSSSTSRRAPDVPQAPQAPQRRGDTAEPSTPETERSRDRDPERRERGDRRGSRPDDGRRRSGEGREPREGRGESREELPASAAEPPATRPEPAALRPLDRARLLGEPGERRRDRGEARSDESGAPSGRGALPTASPSGARRASQRSESPQERPLTRHADFVTWQPPEEEGDDEPILAEPVVGRVDAAEGPGGALATESDAYGEIYVNLGRRDGVRAADFQRALIERGDVARDDVGRIRVRERNAFISVRRAELMRALDALNGATIVGKEAHAEVARGRSPGGAEVEDASSPPDVS
ncbi:DEAD/DEAH box helicase [Chondromyces apiculatus]|uniref:Cold-shock DEAD-box protein A n=1 Tax=Chondromyces apiculatus DSM 436 TaxID=1192034 RepID=A0A017SZB1_9BACT|nr:DEAD/DEAH box helicase [Chondromyces apiculatus]EYF01626.1 Cold-shock DEAD-box protein A [Chondromyces apiculatus DSM 436]